MPNKAYNFATEVRSFKEDLLKAKRRRNRDSVIMRIILVLILLCFGFFILKSLKDVKDLRINIDMIKEALSAR